MSLLLDKIRSRGYWRVVIRPTFYDPRHIANINDLNPILRKSVVQLRGWSFPQCFGNESPIYGNYAGEETDWEHYVELWRFYQSGQFVHYAGIREDWRDQSSLWPARPDWEPSISIDQVEVIWGFTEIFEFAMRLADTPAGHEGMHVEIAICNIKGRRLRDKPGSLLTLGTQEAYTNELNYDYDLSHVQLKANTKELALKPAKELFQRFEWNPSFNLLRDIQSELFYRGAKVVNPQ